jgi:hypothetical protein
MLNLVRPENTVACRLLASERQQKQQLYNNRYWATASGNSNRVTAFSVRSVLRCYKQKTWSDELVVRQSPACKNVSTEAEDTIRINHLATAGKNVANWEDFICAVVTVICEVCRTVSAQSLFVVTFRKCSINPINKPNPVYSHSKFVAIHSYITN